MATTLCRLCVVSAASSSASSFYQQQPCTSSTSVICSAAPCLRTNLGPIVTDAHAGASLSLCYRGRVSLSRKARVRAEPLQIVLLNVDTQIEQDLYFREELDDAEPLSGIIVPNVDAHRTEEALSEVQETLDIDVDELDNFAEREEDKPDFWLEEFQKHLPRDVEGVQESWRQVSEYSGLPRYTSRRRILGAPMFMSMLLAFGWSVRAKSAHALVPAKIDLTEVPKSEQFDASDSRLRDAVSTFRQALDAPTVEEEERLWTKVIDEYGKVDAQWVPDIVARALGNRGNARSRQGQLELALGDYNRSIELAPYAVDPVLNRGVALESLGRLEEASADYEAVLRVRPEDPAAWNNLGNVKAALSQWNEALVNYARAVQLAPKFSFAAANYALALYQVGRDNEAVRQFRNLLRRYPEFADVRAALAVSLYEQGLYAEAESNWDRLEDARYANREWVRNTRRWPPRLANALEDFLDVKRPEL
ncbi:unnamed protein product [Calypogeia fissa]